ncbi:MAG: hypothetical protein KAJ19_23385 [Gammaproteobacteria bacterium]|nr:hypothetical protein [Gammaproteobacteria bacterium]
MKRRVIKNIKELSNAWMMLYAACSEAEAVQMYQNRYGMKPKSVIVLQQTTGDLIYMDIPFKG